MIIAGIDEVGRGPLAGPVVSAAVCFSEAEKFDHFVDSKQLTAKRRELLYKEIIEQADDWCICAAGPRTIDERNILGAALLSMEIAFEQVRADSALVDGNQRLKTDRPHEAVVKGDAKHFQIGAASIIAKVWRDRLLREYAEQYPLYGFESHAGYPTKGHLEALVQNGPCPIHRRSFRPVAEAAHRLGSAPLADTLDDDGDVLVITRGGQTVVKTPLAREVR